MGLMFNLDILRQELMPDLGFRRTRVDGRMVHHTGFDEAGDEYRAIHPGTHVERLLAKNHGVVGPLAVESTYSGHTVRVRLLRGTDLLRVWDLPESMPSREIDGWFDEFKAVLDTELVADATARSEYRV